MDNSEQAPAGDSQAPSLEQRIGSIFERSPAAETPVREAPQPAAEPTDETTPDAEATSDDVSRETPTTDSDWVEVEYEGETYKLPPKLKEAVIRQSDYTKKTQEVAQQRQLYEQTLQQTKLWQMDRQFSESVATEQAQLSALDSALKQFDALDWRNMSTDDIVRTKLELDRLKEQRQAVEKSIDGKRGQFQQAVAQHQQQLIRQGQEFLTKAIPGWNDSLAKEVVSHAISDGYTEAEVQSILDPRNVKTLWKAMQYDKLQQKAKTTVQEAKSIKTTPTQPMDSKTKDYLNYRKQLQKAPPNSESRKKLVQDRVSKIFGG